jgi:rod shape-determining protein MreB
VDIGSASGHLIVDIGGGTAEMAVISLGGIVAAKSVRIGGNRLDAAIIEYARRKYGLAIGERTAEAIKCEVGSAAPSEDDSKAEIRGRTLDPGTPKTVIVGTDELRAALSEPVARIVDAVRLTLADSPPELAHDVLERGMLLTGGGALLRGLAARLEAETGTPVRVAEQPLQTVVRGAGHALPLLGRRGGSPLLLR